MRRKIWEFVISKKLRIGILIKRIYGISDKNSKHIPCGRTTTIDPLGEERWRLIATCNSVSLIASKLCCQYFYFPCRGKDLQYLIYSPLELSSDNSNPSLSFSWGDLISKKCSVDTSYLDRLRKITFSLFLVEWVGDNFSLRFIRWEVHK